MGHSQQEQQEQLQCVGNHEKLKESKKLVRVAFHIRNSRHKKQRTDPLLVSFQNSQQNQKFKQTRVTVGEIIKKVVFTVASQICEGDGNLFAEQFFSNIVDNQQPHRELQFSSQFITPSTSGKQSAAAMSGAEEQSPSLSSSSPSQTSTYTNKTTTTTTQQMCSSYNYKKTQNCKTNNPQLLSCYYCDPLTTTSPTQISSREDVINEIQKRIVITSMSFPNSKSDSNITILRSNLNNIIDLQDMQHVSVYVMPLPQCFRQAVLAFSMSLNLSTLPSTIPSLQFSGQEEEDLSLALLDHNHEDDDLDVMMQNQFYEALPCHGRTYSSQSIQEEDLPTDSFRKSEILDHQPHNGLQLSTRSSSNKQRNQKKAYNSHLSISLNNNNDVRLQRCEEDSSQVSIRPNSTYVSQIFSATESLSVQGEDHQEIMEESLVLSKKKQKCAKEQKQQISKFEGLLQKRVKLNQDPISNINTLLPIHNEQLSNFNQYQQHSSKSFFPTAQAQNQLAYSPSLRAASFAQPLFVQSENDISYEKFIEEISFSRQAQQSDKINKTNQQKEQCLYQQQQQFFFLEQELSQMEKCSRLEDIEEEEEDEKEETLNQSWQLQKSGGDANQKLNGHQIMQNFNFNFGYNDNPDFLGSDTELLKSTLSRIESTSKNTYKTQQPNFNSQTPLTTQQSQDSNIFLSQQHKSNQQQHQHSPLQQQLLQKQQSEQIIPTEQYVESNLWKKCQSAPSTIESLKEELRAQIFQEDASNQKNKKERCINRIFRDKKEVKKERLSRINDQNMELILKLDNEISKIEKQKQSQSLSSSPFFEDQSTRHTNSQNSAPSQISNYLKKQIKISRVLRFLDDSLLSYPEEISQRMKSKKEELEQLCRIIFTLSKKSKFTSKSYTSILEESTKQLKERFFVNKEDVNALFQDLLQVFPNWIILEQTNFGRIFQVNYNYKFRQIKNFFKQY